MAVGSIRRGDPELPQGRNCCRDRNMVFDLQEFEEVTFKGGVGPWCQHSGLIKDPDVCRDPGHSFPLEFVSGLQSSA